MEQAYHSLVKPPSSKAFISDSNMSDGYGTPHMMSSNSHRSGTTANLGDLDQRS